MDACVANAACKTQPELQPVPVFGGEVLPGPIVGLLYSPVVAITEGRQSRWHRHVLANAAPRDRQYMEALFRQHFPTGEIGEVCDSGSIDARVAQASTVVLLYPDAIGLDFTNVEALLRQSIHRGCPLVLNGRGRLLKLTSMTRSRLMLRRFLEWTRIPEFVFLVVFLILTPGLLIADFVRGKR